MSNAPIVLFVYNRADHLAATYSALSKCGEASESDLYIFSDSFKNESAKEGVLKVREMLKDIKAENTFRSVTVTESPVNKGLAASIIGGVTSVLEKHGKVIVLEDDCVVSPYFLHYMNNALDFYKDRKNVGSVTGYVPELNYPEDYKADVFFAHRSCSWSWGTWADRWENVDWELKDMGDFYNSPRLIRLLNSNGDDRFIRLYRQTKGNGSSWSVRFGAHLVKNGWLTVYPRSSYVSNIGCDESGVHSTSEDAENVRVDITKALKDPTFEEPFIDNRIQRLMKKKYSSGTVSSLKRLVATCLIVLKNRK